MAQRNDYYNLILASVGALVVGALAIWAVAMAFEH